MGRKSKLSDKEWADVRERLLAGESVRALAREYGVSSSRISEFKTERVDLIKDAANQLVAAECSVKSLKLADQPIALDYAARLRSLSSNLLEAAHNGAETSAKLSRIAKRQAALVDEHEPMNSQQELQSIAALTKLSNDAAQTGVNLLRSAKDDAMKPAAGGTEGSAVSKGMTAEEATAAYRASL